MKKNSTRRSATGIALYNALCRLAWGGTCIELFAAIDLRPRFYLIDVIRRNYIIDLVAGRIADLIDITGSIII